MNRTKVNYEHVMNVMYNKCSIKRTLLYLVKELVVLQTYILELQIKDIKREIEEMTND